MMNNLVNSSLPNRFTSTWQFPTDKEFDTTLTKLRAERATLNKLVSQFESLNITMPLTYADVMYVVEHLTKLYNNTCDLLGIFTDAQASIIFNDKFNKI